MTNNRKAYSGSAVSECLTLVETYVSGSISLSAFRSQMRLVLSPIWSDDVLKENLSAQERELLTRFDYWTFGRPADRGDPGEDPIPVKATWVYGESTEEFGWYDQDAYKVLLRSQFLVEGKPHKS